ncbi:MAG: hypothetical protein ABI612_06150 [Betaproteobacteria bacterium]
MARVAELPCLACGKHGVELHHIRKGIGAGRRATNFQVLPLCATCHRTGGHRIAYHAGSKVWQAKYGSELQLLEKVRRLLEGRSCQSGLGAPRSRQPL